MVSPLCNCLIPVKLVFSPCGVYCKKITYHSSWPKNPLEYYIPSLQHKKNFICFCQIFLYPAAWTLPVSVLRESEHYRIDVCPPIDYISVA